MSEFQLRELRSKSRIRRWAVTARQNQLHLLAILFVLVAIGGQQ